MLAQFTAQIKIDLLDICLQEKRWLPMPLQLDFALNFFLHIDFKKFQYHMNEDCHTPVTDLLFNIFGKVKKGVDVSTSYKLKLPISLAMIFCFSVFVQTNEFLAP
jgi:hypothetical protein